MGRADGAHVTFKRAGSSPAPLAPASEPAVTNNIKVCVRVRPFAQRELGEDCCVKMPSPTQVVLKDRYGRSRSFDYDRAYWSHNPQDPDFAGQETLMRELGMALLANAQSGYNNCLFAYGQTGSGKTYSVLGSESSPDCRGLLPRIIEELFAEIDVQQVSNTEFSSVQFHCRVSYLEIYNEQLRDLLVRVDERAKQRLDVRQHPKLGTYVPGLSENAVTQYNEVKKMLEFGAKTRSVAATNMNAGSSRSHCIFTFHLEKHHVLGGVQSDLRARLNLVDLAGSERQAKSGAEGERLQEGAMINQSLTYLSLVINKLAEASAGGKGLEHVPFRNSKLTHLLQESLSGNSQTVMIAAISPSVSNYEETLGTLRFAQTCKRVTTKAVKNECSAESLISDLHKEISELRAALAAGGEGAAGGGQALLQRLQESEELRAKLEQSHRAQLEEAKEMEAKRAKALVEMGLSFDELSSAFKMDPNFPQLVNISDDPSLSGCLLYFLPPGEDTSLGADKRNKIVLTGLGLRPYMCSFRNELNKRVTLALLTESGARLDEAQAQEQPGPAAAAAGRVLVNGRGPPAVRPLRHMDRIILGHAYCFRLIIPLISVTPNAGRASIFVACQGGIEEALQEVVHEHSPEYAACRAVMDSIQDRIGAVKVQAFLRDFGRALPLVEEGNLITSEVRPSDGLRFRLEVCSDIKTFTSDEPELIVRLYKELPGVGLAKEAVFELPQYTERLGHMREVYQTFQSHPQGVAAAAAAATWGLGQDPWAVCHYKDLLELRERLAQRDAQLARLLREASEAGERRTSSSSDPEATAWSPPRFGTGPSPPRGPAEAASAPRAGAAGRSLGLAGGPAAAPAPRQTPHSDSRLYSFGGPEGAAFDGLGVGASGCGASSCTRSPSVRSGYMQSAATDYRLASQGVAGGRSGYSQDYRSAATASSWAPRAASARTLGRSPQAAGAGAGVGARWCATGDVAARAGSPRGGDAGDKIAQVDAAAGWRSPRCARGAGGPKPRAEAEHWSEGALEWPGGRPQWASDFGEWYMHGNASAAARGCPRCLSPRSPRGARVRSLTPRRRGGLNWKP